MELLARSSRHQLSSLMQSSDFFSHHGFMFISSALSFCEPFLLSTLSQHAVGVNLLAPTLSSRATFHFTNGHLITSALRLRVLAFPLSRSFRFVWLNDHGPLDLSAFYEIDLRDPFVAIQKQKLNLNVMANQRMTSSDDLNACRVRIIVFQSQF